ncbi:MAG: tRNA uridine 5-carboxymethylaminomethyl modification enzyme MnmG [Firmicutes bacterium ADurb.Bin300]|jgi:tRNA uridine 5-carboxymethylaminomethyl modification enzyme|nr:MAG: tRNA uridine 5-carboxymethylaminomethyl modification enzyme MnmG [Firmicutes bacterium ADurb.Bin300]
MEFFDGNYDVAVIGAGHAGIEAALASARLGAATVIFTINLDWIGNLACNPSIGGTSKGHLVREIDALGGEMGKAADKTLIQSRMLNTGKGPAVRSLRAQIDRREYSKYMKLALESQKNLDMKQAEIVSIQKAKEGTWKLKTKLECVYTAKSVVIATGTFLGGKIYVGDISYDGGPEGMFPSLELSKSIKQLKIQLRRFKTGTPPRVNSDSVDFSRLEKQPGDEAITPFSFWTRKKPKNREICHITYTNEETKKIILDNINRSPLYSHKIEGIGTRYCPSIEDKIVRFSDKERHQVFIEPCGLSTKELYLQGLSSSLPVDVQDKILKSIPGLEKARVMRNAYAIEYDCINPLSLKPTLEFLDRDGLFAAGQFNGTSGYEEAAAQGLVAGINAAHRALGKPSFILPRSSSYIGTLIDDLVTKGCEDPYRMMTSRSEYRLVLRQDNADLRLTEKGFRLGLISKKKYNEVKKKAALIEEEIRRAKRTTIAPNEKLNAVLAAHGTAAVDTGVKLSELLKRPQLSYEILRPFDEACPRLSRDIIEQAEIAIKYEGYIKRQEAAIAEAQRLENRKLPEDIDYTKIKGLRLEAAEKLSRIRPENVGQASRISGVSPCDISVLLIFLRKK